MSVLYSCWKNRGFEADKSQPVLVFLHGFLGNSNDWESSVSYLLDYPCLAVDLPSHGESSHILTNGFDDTCQKIETSILQHISSSQPVVIVGYSLGGRIAMYARAFHRFQKLTVIGTIVEGGNFGLQTEQDKRLRLRNDNEWARRFLNEPIEQVLAKWYQQPVFSSLNDEQRQALITKRSVNLAEPLANMLISTSLAKQPYLLDKLFEHREYIHYVCGARDEKFKQLAETSQLNVSVVPNAGHNVHIEQPKSFAHIVEQMVKTFNEDRRNCERRCP